MSRYGVTVCPRCKRRVGTHDDTINDHGPDPDHPGTYIKCGGKPRATRHQRARESKAVQKALAGLGGGSR